jgi:endonuclease/exonuclease/phosphatase family metal-dependent hydrolase
MNEPPRRWKNGLLIVAWLLTLASSSFLWMMAHLFMPTHEEFAAVLGIALLGGGCILSNAILWRRIVSSRRTAANVIAAGAAWCSCGAFVLGVLYNADADVPVQGSATAPPTPRRSLRIFDLNVLHGYPDFTQQEERFQRTIQEVRLCNPDILVLQEVWNTSAHGNMAERLGAEQGFNFVYARANGSRPLIAFEEGAAVLSRLPILEANRIILKPRWPWWENRIALVVKLDIGGETLTIAGVHLSVVSPDDQAAYLMELAKELKPDMIIGDLNAEPGSRAIAAFHSSGFVEAMPSKPKVFDHRAERSAPLIDHAFLAPEFADRWSSCAVWLHTSGPGGTRPFLISDHDGILLELQRRR